MKTIFVLISISVALCFGSPLQSGEDLRLIKTSEDKPGIWLNQEEILTLIRAGKGFMDVTDFEYSRGPAPREINTRNIPTELKYNATVREAISKVNTGREQAFLQTFSNFLTRYYSSDTGRTSQLFLYLEVDDAVRKYAGNATAFEVDHGYLQRSIVGRLEGADPTLRTEVVIIGAHIDSVNGRNVTGRSPGADDNGAGATAVLEALKAIVDSGTVFKRTVEFHFYAAEEIGLRGSQAIAEIYSQANVNVVGMLNLDVISHFAEGINDIAIITDFGSSAMADFVKLLTSAYLEWGLRERTCGYGCSDHASWNAAGYPATMGIEAQSMSELHHTENDTYEHVNFNQLNQFVHLAMSLIIEQAEPVNPL